MSPPVRRLALALAVLLGSLALVAADELRLRVEGEGERFVGRPCREASEEEVPTPTLLQPAGPAPEAEPLDTLPALHRARGGEATIEGPSATLARRYEPILNVAKADRFWPVSVPTALDLELEGRFTKFVSRKRVSGHASLADLRPNGGAGQYLDYPAQLQRISHQVHAIGYNSTLEASRLADLPVRT